MQQFTVPQFIDVEDKIIGPLSVRQFIIMLVDFGLVFLAYKVFDFSLFLFSSIIIVLVGFTFAFIKINGAPFHYFLLNLLQTLKRKNLRVWNKLNDIEEIDLVPVYKEDELVRPEVSPSRLSRLALVADTKGYYSGEEDAESNISISRDKNIDDLLS